MRMTGWPLATCIADGAAADGIQVNGDQF